MELMNVKEMYIKFVEVYGLKKSKLFNLSIYKYIYI